MKFKKLIIGGLLAVTMIMSLMTLQVNAEEDGINNIDDTYYTSPEVDIHSLNYQLRKIASENGCEIISNNYISNNEGTYSVVFKSNLTQVTKEVNLISVEPTYQIIEMGSKNFPYEIKRYDSTYKGFLASIYFDMSDPGDYETLCQNASNYVEQNNLNDGYIIRKNLKTGQLETLDFQLSLEVVLGYGEEGESFVAFGSFEPSEMIDPSLKVISNKNDFTYKDTECHYTIHFYPYSAPTIYGQSKKVSITDSNNVIDPNVELVDKEITISNEVINQLNTTNYIAYDMSLLLNGHNIQPNGKVEISIDIPDDYDESKVKVYYEKDGKITDMNAVVKDSKAIFKTDHFSHYILAETNQDIIDAETTDENTEKTKEENASTKTTEKQVNAVQTGDESQIVIYTITCALALLTIIGFVIKKCKS